MKYLLLTLFSLTITLQIFAEESYNSSTTPVEKVDPEKKTDPEKIKKTDSTKAELEQIHIKQSKEVNVEHISHVPSPISKTEKPTSNNDSEPKKESSTESVSSDESVLTFNFIYYLLKYKFSEVIE